jgi:peptide/nickel transport system permease protein
MSGLLRDLFKDYRFIIAFGVVLGLLALSILSAFSPFDPQRALQVPRAQPPSWQYLLGTTWLGQDVFWQLTHAIRNSLAIALVASLTSRVIVLKAVLN